MYLHKFSFLPSLHKMKFEIFLKCEEPPTTPSSPWHMEEILEKYEDKLLKEIKAAFNFDSQMKNYDRIEKFNKFLDNIYDSDDTL